MPSRARGPGGSAAFCVLPGMDAQPALAAGAAAAHASSGCEPRILWAHPWVMFLFRRMQCRSVTYLLFASSSKFSWFLQCCFLIFLDRLLQEMPGAFTCLCFVMPLISQSSMCRIGNTDEQPCIFCSPSPPKDTIINFVLPGFVTLLNECSAAKSSVFL